MDKKADVPLYWDKLILGSRLSAGDTLVLRFATDRGQDAGLEEVELSWPVGEEEALPAQLGTLDVRADFGAIDVYAESQCSRTMSASYADVRLVASEEGEAWLPRIRYELRVDDVPWVYYKSVQALHVTGRWHSSLGPGRDRVVLGCEVEPHQPSSNDPYSTPKALEPGPHRVRMVGFLPSGEELSSEEVVVDLQCHPDSARALKAELDAYKTATADAGEPCEPAAEGGDGCTIAAPGSKREGGWYVLVLAGLLVVRLAGRRARRSHPRRA